MKKLFLIILMILTGISYASAENQEQETQRYVVANKKGKARFVKVHNVDGKWKYDKNSNDVYFENGVEFEGFKVDEDRSLNYKGTEYMWNGGIVVSYEGQYYKVIFPDKDIKPVNEKGEVTSKLGIRNYLSNTIIGEFYRTTIPGLIGLICVFFSAIFVISGLFKEKAPSLVRWGFVLPLCVISLLEIGAAFSVGTDAAWWVNPDDVGYWVATPLLIPYFIGAGLMIFSYKLYKYFGKVDNPANIIISTLLIIGIILSVISAIYVICNFAAAALGLLGLAWMFKGISSKDANGNTINYGPLGTYKTDKYGNTTRLN